MFIKISPNTIVNTDKLIQITIGQRMNKYHVIGVYSNTSTITIAEYPTEEQAQVCLEVLLIQLTQRSDK